MSALRLTLPATVFLLTSAQILCAQTDSSFKSISLANLDAFAQPAKNWVIASDAVADPMKPQDMKAVSGQGALVNAFVKTDHMDLYTRDEFGDVQLELDFMMAKNSNSGIYLMGRYELQLLDSWTKLHPTAGDLCGIYYRAGAAGERFEGTPPLMNVARAPGLWQHISLRFRAPKFNDRGEKTENARFDEVYLNGVLVQQMVSVTGPTTSAGFKDEKPKGPIMLQGDHGPVAFKNIRCRDLPAAPDSMVMNEDDQSWSAANPILLNPSGRPRLLRSFMNHDGRKLTHIISVGDPSQVNFAYDLKSGAIFQVWRGQFLDVTRMWHDRGEPQLAVPLGSVVRLSDAPAVAVLSGQNDAWPDSLPFDDFITKGYNLDKNHLPTFHYSIKGLDVSDSLSWIDNGQGLQRKIAIEGAAKNAYVRIAADPVIENISGDLYALNGKAYYLRIDKKFKPVIRQTQRGKELIIKYDPATPVTYSLIW